MRPTYTRLRWVKAQKEATIERYLRALGFRVEIKQLLWNDKEKKYVLFFIPPDDLRSDVKSGELKD